MAEVKPSREFFRIEYPITDRPPMVLNGRRGALVNLSENGVKWEAEDGTTIIAKDDNVFGRITFSDGSLLDVSGKCIRSQQGVVAVELTKPIALSRIMGEQRNLIQKFGDLKQ